MADTGIQNEIGATEEQTRGDSPLLFQELNGVLVARKGLPIQKGAMIIEKEGDLSHLIDTTGEVMSLRIGEDMSMRISEVMSMRISEVMSTEIGEVMYMRADGRTIQ